ncbi:putative multiple-sugar transport system permease YteP [Paenibacillus konkukensis]|uniref:Multiple-sugar transport system permease YteP n=1 Tax=Paenibacillus konkukensis TaxID=2020716 RepID=A0ABY4RJL2_9BACL|nr:ABC transporter permease subunit [Paenibacillus konkukensis]UQZ82323.1 putative multiple-sugar transport system permease YteP [Paenibacillus konkukensis]
MSKEPALTGRLVPGKRRTQTEWLARELRRRLKADRHLYFMLIPFVLWYLIFLYKPMYGLQIAFKDYSLFKGITGSPWVGFDNFREFFTGPYFIRNLKNTVMISLYSLVFAFPAPIVLALLINEAKNVLFRKFVQTFTYLPHFISSVVVAGIVTNFLAPNNGLVNLLLEHAGMNKIYFLTIPDYFRTIYIATFDLWKEAGFNSIIYIAALSGVNPTLYEAAVMDGAGRWKQTWHVTIPAIMPTIAVMLILKVGQMMDVSFENIILMYQPATYETSDIISTYVYRAGLLEGRYGLATAVGLFNSAVSLILVFAANRFSKKRTETGLW